MTAQPLFQFGTVALAPAPDCRVVRLQAALGEQLFDIAERARVPKGPACGAKNQRGLRLSPLEDRRSDCLLHDLFRLPAAAKVATQPSNEYEDTSGNVPADDHPVSFYNSRQDADLSDTVLAGYLYAGADYRLHDKTVLGWLLWLHHRGAAEGPGPTGDNGEQ